MIYHTFRKWAPISKGLVLIDSFNGIDLIGNPYFIAKHLLESFEYFESRLVISGKAAMFKALKRIDIHNHSKLVYIHSIRYCYYLATAEYLICDVTFPLYFSRRNEQRYLNTWHGTPLKSLGRRMSDGQFATVSNPQRNFLHATHLLAPNKHTENVLLKDYMIEPIWDGTILRGGYPRNDVFFKSGDELAKIPGSSDYNVAFMPTWRGKFADMEMKTNILLQEFEGLLHFMEQKLPDNIRIWVRLHPLVREQLKLQGYAKILPMPPDREPYEFIAQCNALLTDYSSVMFDFALSKKPILLYIPDLEEYQTNRGFCLDFAEIPFPKVKKESDLVELLAEFSRGDFSASASYDIFVKRFCPFDAGHSTEDLCAHFIKGCKRLEEHAVRPDHEKKNVLLFP
ncbi:CDP-glycerol glycerophosphotransferase family protein, partial [bacterium]|nr:CDP-glycerol glycerophosphotransferase family protein [bacterium]